MDLVKIDYNKLMETEINEVVSKQDKKATLLLHSCCGPCSTSCLERLVSFFDVTVYFYNPNIDPLSEYNKRVEAQKKFIDNCTFTKDKVKLIVCDYERDEFEKAIDLQNFPFRKTEKEKQTRCGECYNFRLIKTATFANQNNFGYWASTLTLSPYKDGNKVNQIGFQLQQSNQFQNTKYLPSDFKKKNGYLRSIELCKEYDIYRQPYCGCVYGRLVSEQINSKSI